MPPKKKSGKKGKKSGKSTAPAMPEPMTAAMGRDFYLLQIRDLENRINRYQKKWADLSVSGKKTEDEYYHTVKDRDEMVAFLKKSLEQRADELADLHSRYLGLLQTKEADREYIEAELQRMKNEQQETKESLRGENVQLTAKLASLDEFKYKKDELQTRLTDMEMELVQQQKEHREKVQLLQEKAVYDKDRLKKEMVMRVNQVAADFRKVSNKQMAETTKRTIRENVSINAQISKMHDKTAELEQENADLLEKTKKQRETIEKMEQNEKELAKRNNSNQRIAMMLTEKSTTQESVLTDFEERDHQYIQLEDDVAALREELEANRERMESLVKRNEEYQEELDVLNKELLQESKREKDTDKVLSDVIDVLKKILMLNPTELKPVGGGGKTTALAKQSSLLPQLLAAASRIGVPNGGDAGDDGVGVGGGLGQLEAPSPYALLRDKTTLSEMPGSRLASRGGSRQADDDPAAANDRGPTTLRTGGPAVATTLQGPRYHLGDLGLVPRLADVIPTKVEMTRGREEQSHADGMRRVLTKSVSVQTVSAPKALFFADQLLSQITDEQRHAAMAEFLKTTKSKKTPPTTTSTAT